jgi:ribosome-associated toxin RatA of RatAB toxin-antitoxin module
VLTLDERGCRAEPDLCFQVAADVEAWPRFLSHYRWVRFHRKDGFATGVVEMAAWRRFGFLPYPTWWVSEMDHDPGQRVVRYRHVDGVTRGMDVLWTVTPTEGGGSVLRIVHEWEGPRWPVIGPWAAGHVIGPWFIHAVAERTLAGVAAEAERRRPGVG